MEARETSEKCRRCGTDLFLQEDANSLGSLYFVHGDGSVFCDPGNPDTSPVALPYGGADD